VDFEIEISGVVKFDESNLEFYLDTSNDIIIGPVLYVGLITLANNIDESVYKINFPVVCLV
jgi:hypothetical protein